MAKRKKEARKPERIPQPVPRSQVDALGLATLAGVVVVLLLSFSNFREIGRIQASLDSGLDQIEDRIAAVSNDAGRPTVEAAADPPRRGPDPDRVHAIRVDGAPAKGPSSAPITIAEFSDFQ